MYPCSFCSLFSLCSFHFLFHWGILFFCKMDGRKPIDYKIRNLQHSGDTFFLSFIVSHLCSMLFLAVSFLSLVVSSCSTNSRETMLCVPKSKQFATEWTGTSPVTTKCGVRNVHQFSLMSINFLVWFRAVFLHSK